MTGPGVAFNEPPASLLAQATALVQQTAAQLPPVAKGGVVAVATPIGWNAAVVHRAGEQFEVVAWVGKSWRGGLTGGAAVRKSW